MVAVPAGQAAPGPRVDVLASGDAGDVLSIWEDALSVMLRAEDLDGMATALYTVGGPVKMDALFEAYMAAAGSRDRAGRPARPGEDLAADLSSALETLADLGVVELGTDDSAGGLTVTLSRLGVWGMHRHLRAQGWHVPVLGGAAKDGAAGCDERIYLQAAWLMRGGGPAGSAVCRTEDAAIPGASHQRRA